MENAISSRRYIFFLSKAPTQRARRLALYNRDSSRHLQPLKSRRQREPPTPPRDHWSRAARSSGQRSEQANGARKTRGSEQRPGLKQDASWSVRPPQWPGGPQLRAPVSHTRYHPVEVSRLVWRQDSGAASFVDADSVGMEDGSGQILRRRVDWQVARGASALCNKQGWEAGFPSSPRDTST